MSSRIPGEDLLPVATIHICSPPYYSHPYAINPLLCYQPSPVLSTASPISTIAKQTSSSSTRSRLLHPITSGPPVGRGQRRCISRMGFPPRFSHFDPKILIYVFHLGGCVYQIPVLPIHSSALGPTILHLSRSSALLAGVLSLLPKISVTCYHSAHTSKAPLPTRRASKDIPDPLCVPAVQAQFNTEQGRIHATHATHA